MRMPPARAGSWEDVLHHAVDGDSLFILDGTNDGGIPGLERSDVAPAPVSAEGDGAEVPTHKRQIGIRPC